MKASEIRYVYDKFYVVGRQCGCSDESGHWPNNFIMDGQLKLPAVCEACEWLDKQRTVQDRLVSTGYSLPIPPRALSGPRIAQPNSDIIRKNPMSVEPYLWEPTRKLGADSWKVAGNIARALTLSSDKHELEHIVLFVSKTLIIDLTYKQAPDVRDLVSLAPVVVYWHNNDSRQNNTWVQQMVYSRNVGLTFVVEE